MAGANLAFSKVVATPTPTAWSQAYSAGSLFAAISLQSESIPQTEEDNLNSLGKDLISTLESEFFTLENKDLESIKSAINTTIAKVQEGIKLSLVVCYLNDNVLYLYAVGGGKAVLKRGEKIGTVLDGEEGMDVKSASGYVQDKDVIILQTQPFLRIIASSTLASSLDRQTPEEVAEELAPHVHEKSEGGASAVILSYNNGISEAVPVEAAEAQGISEAVGAAAVGAAGAAVAGEALTETRTPTEEVEEPAANLEKALDEDESEEDISEIVRPTAPMEQKVEPSISATPEEISKPQEQASPFLTDQQSRRRLGKPGFGRLPRGRRLIGIILILLAVVIIIAGAFTLFNKKSSSNTKQFEAIYNEARSKYEEGQSLKDLNASLSQQSFKEAQQILQENKDTFPQGSKEDQQIEALLTQVNAQISGGSSGGQTSEAVEVDKSESKILSYQIDNPNAVYFTQNDDFVYFLDGKGVNKIDKGNNSKTSIIDKSWKTEGGIGVFGSNIYVLDKTSNIYKFVPSGDDFSKTNYFASDAPDLSGSAAMAIDGSIYVLGADGNIMKFTKGTKDDFSISGLEKPLASPTRINTTEDGSSIYILDKGNSRIVVLSKDGKFQKAYSSDILKNARDFDPQEVNKAIFVLSGDKVYKIDMK